MEFPYIFTASYTKKIKSPDFCPCTIKIYAIHLQLIVNIQEQLENHQDFQHNKTDSRIYKYSNLKFNNNGQKTTDMVRLIHNNQQIFVKINDSSDFIIFKKILQLLIPTDGFKQHFRFCTILQDFTNQQIIVMTGQSKKNKMNHLIRSLKIDNKAAEQQLEIIRTLNHRCFHKPETYYVDNSTHSLKLIYKYFRGIYLWQIYKLKKIYPQQQLRQFARKILFGFEDLENKHISYNKIQQNIILKNCKIIYPVLINFSSAELRYPDHYPHTNFYKKLLGQILYKLIFFKNPQKDDIQTLKKTLSRRHTIKKQLTVQFRQYSKNFFQFLIQMLSEKQNISLAQCAKHQWLIYKNYKNLTQKLETIKSLQSEEKSAITIKFQEPLDDDDIQSSKDFIFQQYEGISTVQNIMKQYNFQYVIHRTL